MKPTTLYRLYSDTFELLYVGISNNPWRRFEQHCAGKPWWDDVAHVRTVHYPDREQAALAEVDAIRSERPRHNIAHAHVDIAPQPALVVDQIRAVCSLCGELIDPPGGYLELNMRQAQHRLSARQDPAAWGGEIPTPAEYLEVAWTHEPWRAYHNGCRWDADGENPVHQIELRDLRTWFDLCRITADLMGLRVFEATNWKGVLRALGSGEPGLLRAVPADSVVPA